MSKKKVLAVCPLCRTFYSYNNSRKDHVCEDCKGELFDVSIDYDVYMSFSDEEKIAFKQKYLEEHFANYVRPFHPEPQSGWVGFMGCCGWFTVIGLLIAGILCSVLGSFAIGLALMISAPVSGGALILFSIVAEDVRHIRNQVDKLHYDRDHQ